MEAGTVTCPRGHPNPEHQHFCGECGAPLTSGPRTNPAPKPEAKLTQHDLQPGDRVRVLAPAHKEHGKVGTVDTILNNGLIAVPFEFWTYEFRPDELQLVQQHETDLAASATPVPDDAPQAEQSKPRLIQLGVLAVVVLLGGWFVWHQWTGHQEATKTEHLTESVQQSMQDKFNSDPNFSKYHIQVEKVQLINESGNKYTGIATVRTPRSSSDHEVAIEVTADGSNIMWQAQPGALLFLVQEAMQGLTTPAP